MSQGMNRRSFIRLSSAGVLVFYTSSWLEMPKAVAQVPVPDVLLPGSIPKFVTPLPIPAVMPMAGQASRGGAGDDVDYYEISARQVNSQVLPEGPMTTVWAYGPAHSTSPGDTHHSPASTIEAQAGRKVRVRWVNELVDDNGNYLPHLLPVDPTLHWANPPGGVAGRDSAPTFSTTPGPYTGPVPLVTHLHGAVGVSDESDGYTEAWFLPAAANIPQDFATEGTWYDFFASKAAHAFGAQWREGEATFQYPNDNRASTLWFHDHTLGMTRLNTYAGLAGFYLVRGGASGDDEVLDSRTGLQAVLPGPAPAPGDESTSNQEYREIPLAIQDRSFLADNSLFYPNTRQFFDGIDSPYIPSGEFPPFWNPEFFGNTLMVNGRTWPTLTVAAARYRFRVLNGCQSRFLIIDFSSIPGAEAWQIGNEGGFLDNPVDLTTPPGVLLPIGPAERVDVIVDFTNVAPGDYVLRNLGPDQPYRGGRPGVDFSPADPDSTGMIMQFTVTAATQPDPSTPAGFLRLPELDPLPAPDQARRLALMERMASGFAGGVPQEGPAATLLGVVGDDDITVARSWMDEVTENPDPGATELWELFNTTEDAHPIHVHAVTFEVVERQDVEFQDLGPEPGDRVVGLVGAPRPPESWEGGRKDTVVALPGQVTRIKATFDVPGQFVWHCHVLEHEDNEMMRPFRVGPVQDGQPVGPHFFLDVLPGRMFFEEIEWMAATGISTGWDVPGGKEYRPDQEVYRDAMAAFMYRLAGQPPFDVPRRSPFRDVTPSTMFYKEMAWLASEGISTGWPDGTFRPWQPVLRDAMAAFMYRLAGQPPFDAPPESPFVDVTPSTMFYKEMAWLASEGISTGWPDGTFRPWQPVLRDAMAAFMYRLKTGGHV